MKALAKARAATPVSDKERRTECCTGSERLKGFSLSGIFLVASTRPHQLQQWISPSQQRPPWDCDLRLNQTPEDWHQVAMKFRRSNSSQPDDT